jgi:hypothetical protein
MVAILLLTIAFAVIAVIVRCVLSGSRQFQFHDIDISTPSTLRRTRCATCRDHDHTRVGTSALVPDLPRRAVQVGQGGQLRLIYASLICICRSRAV